MSVYTLLWLGWFGYFLVVEGVALFNSKPGDTLSEHVWMWFATDTKGRKTRGGWAQARRFILLAFMAWLAGHFLTGGWF